MLTTSPAAAAGVAVVDAVGDSVQATNTAAAPATISASSRRFKVYLQRRVFHARFGTTLPPKPCLPSSAKTRRKPTCLPD